MTAQQPEPAPRGGVSHARKFFGWAIIVWQVVLLVGGAALGRLDEVVWPMPFWLVLAWALLHDWSREEER